MDIPTIINAIQTFANESYEYGRENTRREAENYSYWLDPELLAAKDTLQKIRAIAVSCPPRMDLSSEDALYEIIHLIDGGKK